MVRRKSGEDDWCGDISERRAAAFRVLDRVAEYEISADPYTYENMNPMLDGRPSAEERIENAVEHILRERERLATTGELDG